MSPDQSLTRDKQWVCLLRRWKGKILSHPDDKTLQAFLDGELKRSQSQEVLSHLASCDRCRQEMSQRKAAWLRFQQLDSTWKANESLLLSDGLQRVLGKIEEWQIAHAPEAAMTEIPYRLRRTWLINQISCELETYLGAQLTSDLVCNLVDHLSDNQSLIARASSLLSAFLGQKVEARISQRIQQIFEANQALV